MRKFYFIGVLICAYCVGGKAHATFEWFGGKKFEGGEEKARVGGVKLRKSGHPKRPESKALIHHD